MAVVAVVGDFGRRESDQEWGALIAQLMKNLVANTESVAHLEGQVGNIINTLKNYPSPTDLNTLIASVKAMGDVQAKLTEAAIKDPFSPLRNGEGKALIGKVERLEKLVLGAIAFLAGLGILQIVNLAGLVK